jgi:hypothetical protein
MHRTIITVAAIFEDQCTNKYKYKILIFRHFELSMIFFEFSLEIDNALISTFLITYTQQLFNLHYKAFGFLLLLNYVRIINKKNINR